MNKGTFMYRDIVSGGNMQILSDTAYSNPKSVLKEGTPVRGGDGNATLAILGGDQYWQISINTDRDITESIKTLTKYNMCIDSADEQIQIDEGYFVITKDGLEINTEEIKYINKNS